MIRLVERDRCPGVLRPYHAVDGNMVRFRCPGGFVQAGQLRAVMDLAVAYANGEVQLTSRNNLQIRALPEPLPGAFVAEAFATGLLPAAAHERIRTLIASPLSSIAPVAQDVSVVSAEIDARLTAVAELADLPGRFLFVLDDGRGDVLGEAFDLAYQAEPDGTGVVFVGGTKQAARIPSAEAAGTLIELARRFVAVNATLPKPAWHTRELANPAALLDGIGTPAEVMRPDRENPVALGVVGGAASVGVPLGLLSPEHVDALAEVAAETSEGRLILTPWRGVIVPGGAAHVGRLAQTGLVVSDTSVWSTLTACYGTPCNNARCDTRAIAHEVAAQAEGPFDGLVHISGCDRVCGEPGGVHVSVIAPQDAAEVLAAAVQ